MILKFEEGSVEYSTHGPKNNIPLIYCVGFGESKEDIHNKRFVEKLSKYFFVITFDYRGLGNSSGKISEFNTSNMVKDLRRVCDFAKNKYKDKSWKEITLVGWSHGSIVALIYSAKQKIKNLILIGYDGFIEKESDFSKAWKRLGILPNVLELQKGELIPNKNLPIPYSYHVDLKKYKRKNILSKIKAQNTLILQGSKDDFAKTKKDLQTIKKSKLYKISNTGHKLNILKVLPIIKKFIFDNIS